MSYILSKENHYLLLKLGLRQWMSFLSKDYVFVLNVIKKFLTKFTSDLTTSSKEVQQILKKCVFNVRESQMIKQILSTGKRMILKQLKNHRVSHNTAKRIQKRQTLINRC